MKKPTKLRDIHSGKRAITALRLAAFFCTSSGFCPDWSDYDGEFYA